MRPRTAQTAGDMASEGSADMPIVGSSPDGRPCTRCGQFLPWDAFYFNKKKDIHYAHCKACHHAYERKRRARDPETERARDREDYWRNHETRLASHRRHNAKPETKEKAAAYREANRDRARAYCRDHSDQIKRRVRAWRAPNRDRALEACRRWRAANRDAIRHRDRQRSTDLTHKLARRVHQARYRERNRDRVREAVRRSDAANPERRRVSVRNRRARLAGATGSFTLAEWESVKAAQAHRCLMCGRIEPDIKLTVDHIIPVSRGGANDISNIQGLCGRCNSKKGARPP